jgi:fibronectin-binding autotransporter adhesin
MRFRPLYLALGFLCIGILNSHAQATWNVTSGNWSSNGSWLSGVAPLNNGTVNTTFAIGAAYTSTVDVNYSVASVNVQPGSANFSLLGSTTLTVGAGGFNDASGTNVTVDPVLTGAMVLTQSGSGTLTLNAFNTYTGNTNVSSGTLTDGGMNNFSPNSLLEVESGGTVNVANNETVSGLNNFLGSGGSVVIASGATLFLNGTPSTTFSGVISGPGDFEQDGTSTITLKGTNTYTGSTSVGAGSDIDLGGGGATGSIASLSVIGNGSISFDRNNAYTYAGNISTGVHVVQSGSGTTTLSGVNTYSGSTAIIGGVLQAGSVNAFGEGASAVTVNTTGTLALNGFSNSIDSLSGDPTGFVTLGGGAVLSLIDPASSTAFDGLISGTGSLNTNSYQLSIMGANTYSGGTTITGGTLIAQNSSGSATGTGPILIMPLGSLLLGQNNTLGAIDPAAAITDNGTFSYFRSDAVTISNNIIGTGGITKAGSGNLTLSGTNGYSGQIDVVGGSLIAGSATALGGGSAVVVLTSGNLILDPGMSNTVGSIEGGPGTGIQLNGASLTITGTPTGSYDGIISGSGGLTLNGGAFSILDGANTFTGPTVISGGATLNVGDGATPGASIASSVGILDNGLLEFEPAPSDNISYSNGISGSGGVNVLGVGTITLMGGPNTYAGPTDITGGTLADGSTNTFSAGSRMIIDTGGNLAVNFNETVGDLENGSGAGTVSIASGKTLTTNGILAASPFMGIISGAGSLAINTGGSSQGLGGASTFSGGTTILGGELFVAGSTVGAPGSVVSGPVGTGTLNFAADSEMSSINIDVTLANDIVLNGTMDNDDATTNLTLSGPISGPGGITWCTPNLLELLNANSFTGGVDMREGVLLVGTDTAAGSGMMTLESAALAGYGTGMSYTISNAINITGSAVLGNMDNNNLTLTGPMTGAQNQVTYNGGPSGTLTLAADNNGLSLDTGFIISSGTVIAANNNAFGTNYVYLTGSAGLNVMNGITVANPLNFSGAPNVLSGNGTIGAFVTVDNTVVLAPSASPGNGPGILTFTSPLTLASGGGLHFQLFDATGAAGTGYSLVSAPGGLSLTASPNTFTFNVLTTDASGNAANAINFNSSTAYNWTFANSGSAISGFSPNQFNILTGGFLNPVGGGTFSITEVGNSLELNFTPAPEPSTWAMLAAGVFVLVPFAARRRRLLRVQKP